MFISRVFFLVVTGVIDRSFCMFHGHFVVVLEVLTIRSSFRHFGDHWDGFKTDCRIFVSYWRGSRVIDFWWLVRRFQEFVYEFGWSLRGLRGSCWRFQCLCRRFGGY